MAASQLHGGPLAGCRRPTAADVQCHGCGGLGRGARGGGARDERTRRRVPAPILPCFPGRDRPLAILSGCIRGARAGDQPRPTWSRQC